MLINPIGPAFRPAMQAPLNRRVWGGGMSLPVPLNNLVAVVGDSRTSINSINAATEFIEYSTAYGYVAWLEMLCGYRFKVIGNYGVNANTLDQIITRLTSVETRGQILNSPAGTFIFLGGVNNTTEVIGTVGPKYNSIVEQLTAAGKICIVLNEIPNSDQSTQGAVHLGRRQYLDGAVYADGGRVVKFNSYDLAALTPTSYFPKAGYYGDLLHPNLLGNRKLADGLATPLNQLFAASPVRNALATVKSTQNTMFNGTGGAIGLGATGVLATDWNAEDVPAGLIVSYSKGTDPDGYEQQIITVSGTPTAAAPTYARWALNNYSIPAATGASGDILQHAMRVTVDAGNTGFVGAEVQVGANDNTNAIFLRGGAFAVNIYDNASTLAAPWLGGSMQGLAMDGVVLSEPVTLGAGWTAAASKSLGALVQFTFRGGEAASATIRLSRASLLKNV